MEEKEVYRKINKIFLITYFFLLITIQVIGIYLIMRYYPVMRVEVLIGIIVFITLIWPIILSLILRRIFRNMAKKLEKETL